MSNINLDKTAAKETRLIKTTSKRQITIPKSFFELLNLSEGIVFEAHLFDNGVFLKPQITHAEIVCEQDRKQIIRKTIEEGFSEDSLVEELNYRLNKYDELISRRISEFENDIINDDHGAEDRPGDDNNFNGLDILFD